MTYWIKISYERNQYVIDLDRVSAFVYEPNGTLKFWLPDSSFPIVLNPQGNPDAHQKVMTYIKEVRGQTFEEYWIEISYERNKYLVNLNCISSFECEPNGRIKFWLPDGAIAIIIHPHSNREDYQKVMNYIKRATGYSLP